MATKRLWTGSRLAQHDNCRIQPSHLVRVAQLDGSDLPVDIAKVCLSGGACLLLGSRHWYGASATSHESSAWMSSFSRARRSTPVLRGFPFYRIEIFVLAEFPNETGQRNSREHRSKLFSSP